MKNSSFKISAKISISIFLFLASCAQTDFASQTNKRKKADDATREVPPPKQSDVPTPVVTTTPTPETLMSEEGTICEENIPGYGGKVYQIPSTSARLPDLSKLTPIGQIYAPSLNVPDRSWTSGFPNLPGLIEWFAIRFYAYLSVESDGEYAFKTISDDGSNLYIDGKLAVANDGPHKARQVIGQAIPLSKGIHRIAIEWYQGQRTQIALQVFWKEPAKDWEIVPVGKLNHGKLCGVPELGAF